MILRQSVAAGGREYTINFIGQKDFTNVNDTLRFISQNSDTEEITRLNLVSELKKGLVRYVSKTPYSKYLKISFVKKITHEKAIDNWNYWVFSVDTYFNFDGEESKKKINVNAGITADRITDDLKMSFLMKLRYRSNKYEFEGKDPYTSISKSKYFKSLIVKSLGNKFSAGIYASAISSTYENKKLSLELAPAIEYNIYPYSDYNHTECRILYKAVFNNVEYYAKTIYDKVNENLGYQSLSVNLEIKQRWGSIDTRLEGLNYFHDFSKNRLNFDSNFRFRVSEGLSLNFSGGFSMIHDQLNLPSEGATQEEILLTRKEIATQFEYSFSVGFRYTFGSIFSNIVNPRFGSRLH